MSALVASAIFLNTKATDFKLQPYFLYACFLFPHNTKQRRSEISLLCQHLLTSSSFAQSLLLAQGCTQLHRTDVVFRKSRTMVGVPAMGRACLGAGQTAELSFIHVLMYLSAYAWDSHVHTHTQIHTYTHVCAHTNVSYTDNHTHTHAITHRVYV